MTAALCRDAFGVFASEGLILITTGLDMHKQLFAAVGFEHVPIDDVRIWGMGEPLAAFALDLGEIGLESWIEAIMAGRRPPRVMALNEVKHALHAALARWHDDTWLSACELADSAAVARVAPDLVGAAAVRAAVTCTLDGLRTHATPDLALAYRAVEAAYLRRAANHEKVAEDLAVARTTFYRLLKRGVHNLALSLTA